MSFLFLTSSAECRLIWSIASLIFNDFDWRHSAKGLSLVIVSSTKTMCMMKSKFSMFWRYFEALDLVSLSSQPEIFLSEINMASNDCLKSLIAPSRSICLVLEHVLSLTALPALRDRTSFLFAYLKEKHKNVIYQSTTGKMRRFCSQFLLYCQPLEDPLLRLCTSSSNVTGNKRAQHGHRRLSNAW